MKTETTQEPMSRREPLSPALYCNLWLSKTPYLKLLTFTVPVKPLGKQQQQKTLGQSPLNSIARD